MKKILVGIFAHPDDESFGPSGSITLAAKGGTDVHLICATKGQVGRNPDEAEDLGEVRHQEWLAAGKLMGVRSQTMLNFQDGELCNNQFHEIAAAVEKQLREIMSLYQAPVIMDFLTFEPNGISGHIDHIAMSMVTCFIHCRLAANPPKDVKVGQMRQYCVPLSMINAPDTSFVFMPAGCPDERISEVVDASSVLSKKLEVMRAHRSQRQDGEDIISRYGESLAKEHFLVTTL